MTPSDTIVTFPDAMRRKNAYEKLRQIDWTFHGARTQDETHSVHPYPAKFIPQIPRALIAALHPGDDSAVMDVFCGSGTTIVEAGLAGAPAIGIDLNPLACLITKVKVTPLISDLRRAAIDAAARAEDMSDEPPSIPALDHWFAPHVQRALAALIRGIDREPDADVRDALRVAFSRIVVRVSNQESDTRYAAIPKNVSTADVRTFFLRAADAIHDALQQTWGPLFPAPRALVLNQDVLTIAPAQIPQAVSLVVTSPPYPNAYEYWLYHKYRMYWLGMDPIPVREAEIGARPHYFKRKPHTPADFHRQLSAVFHMIDRVMTVDGHACFQVGNSVIRGEHIDNAAIVRSAASEHHFAEELVMTRSIPSARKAFNPRTSRILQEQILVFRKTR